VSCTAGLVRVGPVTVADTLEATARCTLMRSPLHHDQACARISVVYGSGPHKGKAFIDDYIKMSEPVEDYLTRWSGIKPGDLDPGVSTMHLTTLKNAYAKLLLLELRGVCFVGHGLPKDFRVINISPPKAQVCDTVDLYRQPNQRKMALKYVWLHVTPRPPACRSTHAALSTHGYLLFLA
jgi:hypothetical protein